MEVPIYFDLGLKHHSNFKYFFDELNYFKDKGIRMLHLGAYSGHGTRWVLSRVRGHSVDVDTWEGSLSTDGHLDGNEEFYDKRVEDLYDNIVAGLPVVKFKGKTKDFFAQNSKKFNFIYIDASHKKADVELDLRESFKILQVGGVIACDDYLWGVIEDPKHPLGNPDQIPHYAIKEFIDAHADKIEILIDNYQLWFKKLCD
jgi:hypothetical protein